MARLTLSERIEALASVPIYAAYLSQPPPVGYGPGWLEVVRGLTQANQKKVLAILERALPAPPPPVPAPRKKRDFGAHKYERYDPTVEAAGNPAEWRRAFEERMGLGEAQAVLGGRGPRAVLGVSSKATWAEIKSAYKKLAVSGSPGGSPARLVRPFPPRPCRPSRPPARRSSGGPGRRSRFLRAPRLSFRRYCRRRSFRPSAGSRGLPPRSVGRVLRAPFRRAS